VDSATVAAAASSSIARGIARCPDVLAATCCLVVVYASGDQAAGAAAASEEMMAVSCRPWQA
jgi:hypothetical protein